MLAPVLTIDQVRVPGGTVPADAQAVTWRHVRGESVWKYRFHTTVHGAKVVHSFNGRAYDSETYDEWGWRVITDEDRRTGVWLW